MSQSMRTTGSTLVLLSLAALLGFAFAAELAQAQTPFEIQKIIRNPGNPSQADLKAVDSFLKSQVFGPFTKPANAAILPAIRKNFSNLVRNTDKTPAHDFLNKQALAYSQYFIGPKGKRFGAPAQYNAMLLLGELNENDAPNKIKPYLYALKPLMDTVALPPDDEMVFLKPAALIGITRFAEENAIPPSVAPQISASLLKLVNDADPPPGRSASAHNFMRRGAARALAAMGSPGPGNEVVKAFDAIAADPNARITLRCEMSQFLGDLKIPPESKVDLKGLANTIGHQTVEICEQELNRATEAKQPPSRRILMYALDSANAGLTGLARSAERDPEASKFISGIRSKTNSLYRTLDNTDQTPDDKLAEVVAPEIDTIQGMLLAKPAPMVAVGPQDDAARPATAQ